MTHHAPDYPVGLHLNRLNVQSRLPGRYYLLPPIKAKHLAQIVICNCLRVLRLREFDRTGICHFLRCYNDMSSFTIILRGVSFALEEENLRFDSPNYFTSYFLGEFEEGAEGKRLLTLNRHPEIFRIIFEYLSGYEIFPLADGVIHGMSTLALLENLRRDALFFGLDGLVGLVDHHLQNMRPKVRIDYQHTLFVSLISLDAPSRLNQARRSRALLLDNL